MFQGIFKKVPRLFQESFKGTKRTIEGSFKGDLRGFQDSFKGISIIQSFKSSSNFIGCLRCFN